MSTIEGADIVIDGVQGYNSYTGDLDAYGILRSDKTDPVLETYKDSISDFAYIS